MIGGTLLTSASIKERASALGFDLAGVARAERHPKLQRLTEWIASGRAGEMTYLADPLGERLDPQQLLPTARSVVSLGVLYNTVEPYSTSRTGSGDAMISRYAWGADYHDVLRARVRTLLGWMAGAAGPGLEAITCVDTEPIQERVFAEQAGLGWIGKNTCLINPRIGSWVFLAEILTNADLEPDTPGVDQCGACTRCIDGCPTGALDEPYALDATRCLSYLTIEAKGAIDVHWRGALEGRVYGCDICQDVCPWNRRAPTSDDPAWQPRTGLAAPRLLDLCRLSDEAWRGLMRGSAMRRAGLVRVRRSLAYAAAALGPADRDAALDALAPHASSRHEVVVNAVAWARSSGSGRLEPPGLVK